MDDELGMVSDFHRAFEQPIGTSPDVNVPQTLKDFRVSIIREETDELERALANGDPVETLDALEDLLYVIFGAAITFGMQGVLREGFREVHASNMSKVWSDGSIRKRSDGKVLKPTTYRRPDLRRILNLQQPL